MSSLGRIYPPIAIARRTSNFHGQPIPSEAPSLRYHGSIISVEGPQDKVIQARVRNFGKTRRRN